MSHHIEASANSQIYHPIILSQDGYVRMLLETLEAIPLVHLVSGLDDDTPILPQEGASLTPISGYTEWLSVTTPVITLGWDWQMDISQGCPQLVRMDAPRSNIMLVDVMQRDLGVTKTLDLLETVVDKIDWREVVQSHIITRYI